MLSTKPTVYDVAEAPSKFNAAHAANCRLLAQSLLDSRRSIVSGAFLTRANVVAGTVQVVDQLDLHFGIHQFLGTQIARATVTVILRPPAAPLAPGEPQPALPAPPAPRTINVQELVFGFAENRDTYFLVPRDSTLEEFGTSDYLFTFLTLRNQPGGKILQHQVIPVTFARDSSKQNVVQVLRSHINKHAEVKDKMANAMRHIPKMPLSYIKYDDSQVVSTKPATPLPVFTADMVVPASLTPTTTTKKARRKRDEADTPSRVKSDKPKKVKTPKVESTQDETPAKKQKKASIIPEGWSCELCGVKSTVMRRRGPSGLNCACNSCGQSWAQEQRRKSGSVKQEVTAS